MKRSTRGLCWPPFPLLLPAISIVHSAHCACTWIKVNFLQSIWGLLFSVSQTDVLVLVNLINLKFAQEHAPYRHKGSVLHVQFGTPYESNYYLLQNYEVQFLLKSCFIYWFIYWYTGNSHMMSNMLTIRFHDFVIKLEQYGSVAFLFY